MMLAHASIRNLILNNNIFLAVFKKKKSKPSNQKKIINNNKSTTITTSLNAKAIFDSVGYPIVLVVIGAILFASLFPNSIVRFGWGFLGSIALVPVGMVIYKISLRFSFFYGFLYGLLAYGLFNIWLITFSPVSFLVVPIIYASYFIIVFLVLKLIQIYFHRFSFVIQAIAWVLYEYARINGFLGYSFGVLGYSWSFYPLLLQTADIFGIWGITFFLACSSFFLAQIISEGTWRQVWQIRIYKNFIIIYGIVSILIVGYGILSQKNYSQHDTVRIALIQHATDPWKGGEIAYRNSLSRLIAQTKEAMQETPQPDLVIWSETAFVPSISYHLKYRQNTKYLRLIHELYDFLEQYPNTDFLIGNGEGVKVLNEKGIEVRENYNASLFFRGNSLLDTYYKIHLVPFTEYFPYKKIFPRFYKFLENNDVHFWLHGNKYTVFESEKVKFSTPICFESGFGLQNAKFVRAGAEMLVNITNDAWSHVESNAMQHLQLGIIRAIENRRSMVRSTNSGMTGYIDVNGKVISMLPSFQQDNLVEDIAVYTDTNTIYTKFGDWFVFFLMGVVFFLVFLKITKKEMFISPSLQQE